MNGRTLSVVCDGLSQPCSTVLLADQLAAATVKAAKEESLTLTVQVIELRDLAHDIADHLLTGFPPPALKEALDQVAAAYALIAVTPVFAASYTGLFKSINDLV
jgi:FMN reductase